LSENTAYEIGRMAAKLHRALEGLRVPRRMYKRELIGPMREAFGEALRAGHVNTQQYEQCLQALRVVDSGMARLAQDPRMEGLLHADLGLSNILLTEKDPAPIDFSLSGYGYKPMEVGMLATNFKDTERRRAVRAGYEKESGLTLQTEAVEAFFALGILLYIACQHEKAARGEWFAGAMDRWCATVFEPLAHGERFAL